MIYKCTNKRIVLLEILRKGLRLSQRHDDDREGKVSRKSCSLFKGICIFIMCGIYVKHPAQVL